MTNDDVLIRDFAITMVLTIVATLMEVLTMKNCDQCQFFAWRNCYGYSVTAFIYALLMLIMNLWFLLMGVERRKSSVVLCWITMTIIFMVQLFCLIVILILLYSADTDLVTWVLYIVSGLILIGFLLYGILVVVAFWMEMKPNNE